MLLVGRNRVKTIFILCCSKFERATGKADSSCASVSSSNLVRLAEEWRRTDGRGLIELSLPFRRSASVNDESCLSLVLGEHRVHLGNAGADVARAQYKIRS